MHGNSTYTREIGDEICHRMANGESLSQICCDEHMPPRTTVREWVLRNEDGFTDRYARAREALIDHWAEELMDIADDGRNDWEERKGKGGETFIALNKEAVDRSKLRVDARKWYLSKLRPEQFGDKVTNEIKGSLAIGQAIDAPPPETREEWIARRRRELANGASAVVGAATRSTNGRDHG